MAENNTKETIKKTKAAKSADVLVAKAVRTVLAGQRQAAAKTKTRSEVRGGGRKPFRQKGTGRARAGSTRSPIWRGGGITFGPTGEQNFKLGINKKEMQAAKKEVYAAKKNDVISVSTPVISKTKEAAKLLAENKVEGRTLVLVNGKPEEFKQLKKAFSNISGLTILLEGNENIHDLMAARKIVKLKVAGKGGAK